MGACPRRGAAAYRQHLAEGKPPRLLLLETPSVCLKRGDSEVLHFSCCTLHLVGIPTLELVVSDTQVIILVRSESLIPRSLLLATLDSPRQLHDPLPVELQLHGIRVTLLLKRN